MTTASPKTIFFPKPHSLGAGMQWFENADTLESIFFQTALLDIRPLPVIFHILEHFHSFC